MKVIPAINIKNKRCVMIASEQYFDTENTFLTSDKLLQKWERQGAKCIHVTDLDSMLLGDFTNIELLQEIIDSVSIPLQLCADINSIQMMEQMFRIGIQKITFGKLAVEQPLFVKDALSLFGAHKIGVMLRAENGMVYADESKMIENHNAIAFAMKLKDFGLQSILYEDYICDGLQKTLNIEHIKEMNRTGLKVVVTGGINSLKDLEMIYETGAYGAIVDSALYEHKIDLKNAIELFDKGGLQ